jgi:hypothetical protein
MSIFVRINQMNRSRKAWFKYCGIALASFLVIASILIQPAIATEGKRFQSPSCVDASPGQLDKASISSIDSERKVLQVKCAKISGKDLVVTEKNLRVADEKLVSRLSNLSVGDRVNLTFNNDKNELTGISNVDLNVSTRDRFWALFLPSLILFLAGAVPLGLAQGRVLGIRKLLVGYDNRFSNSKSQAAIWFFVLIASYLSITYVRVLKGGFDFVGGISIPQNLLLLSGISAFTYAGAKAITESQVDRNPKSKDIADEGKESLADYFRDDQKIIDFGDFQMSVVTLLAVVVFLVQIFNYIGVASLSKSIMMPDLDTTMLSLFGLGQGAYLAKKAAVASSAADAKPAKDSKVFKLGVKDKEVIEIKKALNKIYSLRGGDALDETSDNFDEKTRQKVIEFQNEKKLSPADGTVDANTLDKLLKG